MRSKYDIVFVGSGFASMFFLHKVLGKRRDIRVLIVERGGNYPWLWQAQNRRNTPERDDYQHFIEQSGMPGKVWPHTLGLGGGSNCWWANPTRIHPDDFRLHSKFGVGVDWPVSYDDLEPFYAEAEEIISVSGDDDSAAVFPRSRPFPQPRHRFSRVARAFKTRYPDQVFGMPQARARVATATRNPCCANGLCGTCPANAKFTIVNDLAWMFQDPRVEVQLRTRIDRVVVEGGIAKGVEGRSESGDFRADGDLIVLGANGVYNPFLLLKSGIDQGPVGKGLLEQVSISLEADLDGIEDGDGSAFVAGAGYNFATGDFRRSAAGGFYEILNLPRYRLDGRKFRQRLSMVFLLDNLREDRNFVGVSPTDPEKPLVHFEGYSPYAHAGLEHVRRNLEGLLRHMPVEAMDVRYAPPGGHSHLQGTTVMGRDPAQSVIDADLLHHHVRNLVVAGSGAFPTAAGSNPTLTIAALSLRSADRLF